MVRALHAFFTAFLFVFWPVIGLRAASNRSFRGMELEGNSPLYRYLFGMEFFMMAVVFSTVTAAYVFLASKMPNIWPVSLLVAIFFSLLTIGLFKPRD